VSNSLSAQLIDSSDSEIIEIKEIVISGNDLTRNKLILSELPFNIGSLITTQSIASLVERAEQNLLNTSLFNVVSITYYFPNYDEVVFEVKVDERWYFWAFPIFEQEGRNFSDFLRLNDGSFFNYGLYFKHNNLRGRNETLKLRMVTGYKNQLILDYENPGYNNQSGFGINFSWMVFDQMPYSTVDDKQVFLKLMGTNIMRQTRAQGSYFYRHHFDHRHRLTISYMEDRVADTLLLLNPNFMPFGKKLNQWIELGYNYQFDRRDSKVYPLKGSFYEFTLKRKGIGVVSDFTGFFHGKLTSSWQAPIAGRMNAGSKLTLSGVDKKEVPYIYRTGLGYDEYLNGFEYKVVDGSSYGALQNKLIFELIPRKEKSLNFIPIKQFSKFHYAFYLKLHADAGYVVNKNKLAENSMANSWLVGYGLGLDMVTFYDKVLSLNYSLNNFGGHGLFFHFNLSM
jgi:outer membrane protein assembly factor BamA